MLLFHFIFFCKLRFRVREEILPVPPVNITESRLFRVLHTDEELETAYSALSTIRKGS